MENGAQMTLDQWMPEIFQKQTVGASVRPAKILVLQENELDSKEIEALSLEKFLELLRISAKKIDPNGLSTKMLRECLVRIEDLISYPLSLKWIGGGYDTEWQLLNSKLHGVPQNRERVYTIGHLRRKGCKKIFPIPATDGKDSTSEVNKINLIGHRDGYHRNLQTFGADGITETLSTCEGGGREHHVAVPLSGGLKKEIKESELASTLMARDYKGIANFCGNMAGYKVEKINERDT